LCNLFTGSPLASNNEFFKISSGVKSSEISRYDETRKLDRRHFIADESCAVLYDAETMTLTGCQVEFGSVKVTVGVHG